MLLIQALVEVFSVFATFAAVLLVDRIGRRVTLLIGVGVMIASNALLVVLYAISSHFTGAAPTLGFIGILFFTAGFKLRVWGDGLGVRIGELSGAPAYDRRVDDAHR